MARHGRDWDLQRDPGEWGPRDTDTLTPAPPVAARDLLGIKVVNPSREVLGRVEDLMLDPEAGVIAYAIVAFRVPGRVKRFAVPWCTLRHQPTDACLIWDVERQTLEAAPGMNDPHKSPRAGVLPIPDRLT